MDMDYHGIIDPTWQKLNQPWKIKDIQSLMHFIHPVSIEFKPDIKQE